jgi:mRNA interferase MazF
MNKKKSGQIALAFFPATSMQQVKLRPVLLLRQLPYGFDDWLICMVSSKTQNYIKGLDDLINQGDNNFLQSGLKVASVIRAARLAVVSGDILLGAIGQISAQRLSRIRQNIATWLSG